MPTGIPPRRVRQVAVGNAWPNTNATVYGTNQTYYLPYYAMRYVPQTWVTRYLNTMTQFVSAANRQHMTNNSGQLEICLNTISDGDVFPGYRASGFNYNGGLTSGAASALTGGVDPLPPTTLASYSRWIGSCLHEYAHSEDGAYFGPGQEPAGKAGLAIVNWPECITLQNDCQANGANVGFQGGHFITSFRVPQRLEAVFPQVLSNVATVTSGVAVTRSGTGASHNSYTLLLNDRVLVWDQTDATVNGIYQVNSGAWTRTTDANTNALLAPGLTVKVVNGFYANQYFALYVDGPTVMGTSPLVFHQDVMLNSAGPGTTGGTPASRVTRWLNICTNNGWPL